MADFDAFTSSDAPAQEEDPAADFLAREQDQLAGLEDDNITGNDAFGAGQADFGGTDDYQMLGEQPSGVPQSLDIFNAGGESSTDDFGGGVIPGLDDLDQRLDAEEQPQDSGDPYSSIRGADTMRAEPEQIRIWREEQTQQLEAKDVDESEKMVEWRENAKKELDDWYRHRDEQFQKTKAMNREGEAEFIKERDETVPGGEWERICRVCEFNPKNSRSQRDVSRMRSILLQLKQSPVTHDM